MAWQGRKEKNNCAGSNALSAPIEEKETSRPFVLRVSSTLVPWQVYGWIRVSNAVSARLYSYYVRAAQWCSAGYWRVWLERQHGAYYEGSGPARQHHGHVHDEQEDDGDKSRQQHHQGWCKYEPLAHDNNGHQGFLGHLCVKATD